jgi:hypothetical protein
MLDSLAPASLYDRCSLFSNILLQLPHILTGRIAIYNCDSLQLEREIDMHTPRERIISIAISPDADFVVTGSHEGNVAFAFLKKSGR